MVLFFPKNFVHLLQVPCFLILNPVCVISCFPIPVLAHGVTVFASAFPAICI